MYHQQTYRNTADDDMLHDDATPVTFGENKKSNCKIIKSEQPVPISNDDKLSTLFNTTGREKNSTGPLKQWLFEHQQHPYPSETDKQELMEKTKMSLAQITVWFTNARVKMRKENKLPLNMYAKKKKKKLPNNDESFHLDDTLSPPFSSQNLSINELSTSFDTEYISDGIQDDSYASTMVGFCSTSDRRATIAYSCLNVSQLSELHRFLTSFPNKIKFTSSVNDETTHLVVGNEERPLLCPLTMKVFQAVGRHLFVVSFRWITESIKQRQILDEIPFEMRGDISFGGFHDGMRHSRLSKHLNLFENCQFFVCSRGCQDKMTKDDLISLIELCHGTIVDEFPMKNSADSSILSIVICDQSQQVLSLFKNESNENSRANGVHFLSAEWVLESIVQFALQPFENYEERF